MVKGMLRDALEVIIVAIVIAFVVRGFVIEPFIVDGSSMEPTLHNGERLFVNRFVYRFEKPKRGDIIVFRYPLNWKKDYIKRVVALGGETVEVRLGTVYINNEPLDEPYIRKEGISNFRPFRVPEGYVFVMGDNRLNSEDSRIFGPVSLKSIRGKAWIVWWPLSRIRLAK